MPGCFHDFLGRCASPAVRVKNNERFDAGDAFFARIVRRQYILGDYNFFKQKGTMGKINDPTVSGNRLSGRFEGSYFGIKPRLWQELKRVEEARNIHLLLKHCKNRPRPWAAG